MTALLQSPGLLGPINFWNVSVGASTSIVLTSNPGVGRRLIICWMTLVARIGTSGDVATISLNGSIIHSGLVGTGNYNRFPLDCLIAVNQGDTIAISTQGTNGWDTTGVGYYAPAFND